MEQHSLTKKEYSDIHKILAEKRAVKEILDSLKVQLSQTIIQEDKWWQRVSSKYGLDNSTKMYTVNHAEQAIIGVNRPAPNNSFAQPQGVIQGDKVEQQGPQTITVRPGKARPNGVLSQEEILNIERARQEFEKGNH